MTLTAANRNALLAPGQLQVVQTLLEYGEGLSNPALADLCMTSQGAMNQRLITLIRKGHVIRTGSHGTYVYYHPDHVPRDFVSIIAPKPSPKPKPPTTVTPINSLTEELAELRAWKKDAITRYPDLAISAEVMKGRDILRKLFKADAHKIHQVDRGELDSGVLMQGILLGMEAK